jgi:hypothetical protein
VHSEALADLSMPALAAPACRGHAELYDAAAGDRRPTQVAHAREAALQICRSCRELQRCGAWVDALPTSQRPRGGVIAGRIITAKSQGLQSKPSL